MGLDWILQAHRPKPGRETDYFRITNKLNALASDKSLTDQEGAKLRSDLEAAFEEVAVSPFEIIGAPRVGIDNGATEWFRTQVFVPMQKRVDAEKLRTADRNDAFITFWGRSYEQVLKDHRGKHVVELAQHQEGVAAITGMLCGALDFRGKAVSSSEALDEGVKNEAYDDHDADECVDYADRLEAALTHVSDEHLDELIDLRSAVKWLRYWGSRGFGYSAWY